jgi:hypothetical protein
MDMSKVAYKEQRIIFLDSQGTSAESAVQMSQQKAYFYPDTRARCRLTWQLKKLLERRHLSEQRRPLPSQKYTKEQSRSIYNNLREFEPAKMSKKGQKMSLNSFLADDCRYSLLAQDPI